jgi:hypothetical protein
VRTSHGMREYFIFSDIGQPMADKYLCERNLKMPLLTLI